MTFATPLPWWAIVVAVTAAGALAWLAYRRASAGLSPRQRALLVLLRAVTLLALAFILLRPVRVVPAPVAGGIVPVLVDASASMSMTDGGQRSRFDRALDVARTAIVPALEPRFVPQLYTFGEQLAPIAADAEVRPEARASRLAEALSDLQARTQGRPFPGIVVISDGAVNLDASGGRAEAPVFAVPIGAERLGHDREVFGISIGDARLQSSLVDVSALVVARGGALEPFDVTLLQNGQPVDVRRHTPARDGSAQRVVFRAAPPRDAATVYTVAVAEGEGEWTLANNRQSVLAPPAGPARRVLLVEGAPGHEHSFLKRSLDEDRGLALDAVVRKGENERGDATFYVQAAPDRARALTTGFPSTREALYAYDAVVLANVDRTLLPAAALAALADFVSDRGGGLVLLGARSFESGGLDATPLAPLLPVELVDRAGGLVRTARVAREPLRVGLTEAGAEHPVMRLGATPADTMRAWDAAPALASTAALGPARPGAALLATTTSPGGVLRPLVAVQRYGSGRVLLFGGEASWRWKMMLAAGDPTYDTFWRQAIRWASAAADPPVAVTARPDDGRRVAVVADVRDAAFARVADAQVRVRVSSPSGRDVDVPVSRPSPGGPLGASVETVESGVHKVSLDARRGSGVLGSAEAWVLVGGVDQEFVDPRLDLDALRRLAEGSGGRLSAPERAGEIAAWIADAASPPQELAQREVWHSPWVMSLVVGLLGAEWTLRRKWGLR